MFSKKYLNYNKTVFIFSQKVNEKPQVINDYEAGRGIPNQVVIGKIEKAIGKWPF